MNYTVEQIQRTLGEYKGGEEGRLFIAIAGIHGNEKTGLIALGRVFTYLEAVRPDFFGKLIGLAGNLQAVELNTRYIDTDLNRIWKEEIVQGIKSSTESDLELHEYRELKALLDRIEEITQEVDPSKVIFVDLHNTSSAQGMFTFTFKGLDNYKVAASLHIPIITGLDKSLQGTAIQYISEKGFGSIAFEGGPLGVDSSIDIHEAGIWLLLEATGCINKEDIPNYEQHKKLMVTSAEDFPEISELRHVHNIQPGDNFKMKPGYTNFQTVEKGEELGEDRNGVVVAPCGGYIMMPLYQKQGDEGFFITKDVKI